LDQEFIEEAH